MYVEAKWDADIGTGKGADEGVRDDQIVLRRDSLRKDPTLESDVRRFVVAGVSNVALDLTVYGEADASVPRSVTLTWLTWDDLASCSSHPRADEFARYLKWKREHGNPRGKAKGV